ncbi:MAG: YihY/virulence factor BrkB family protein [Bacteroidota bacterium]|nr:YihY/virulence factor BrkB family protein [Bacteroidota bacterium]
MEKISFRGLWEVLKNCFKSFADNKIPKLSASLAYYTVFSLGPLLMVILFLCSFFFGRDAVEGSIYKEMRTFVGSDGATQIQEIIKNASLSGKNNVAAAIGVVALLIGATTVFAEIQDSINMIWGLVRKPTAGWRALVKTRLLSFGVIGSLGFLLLVSLSVTAILEGLSDRLQTRFPGITIAVFYVINIVITLAVVTVLFGVIFKVLPDAKIKWKDVLAGSIATAILFMLGKFAITFYISKSSLESTYGAAGSFVVLLVWIYYSSFILYFGAVFTKAWAVKYGHQINPNDYTAFAKIIEVPSENKSAQEIQKEKEQDQEQCKEKSIRVK